MALSKLTVSFGLISIPIRVEPLVGDGSKPKGNYVCAESHTPIKRIGSSSSTCGGSHSGDCKQIVGYPLGEEDFYVPDATTLEALKSEKDGSVSLTAFVPTADVDPAYFDKTYVVRPDDAATDVQKKALWLIAGTLQKKNHVLVGSACLDKDEKMVVVRWSEPFQCLFFCVSFFTEQLRTEKIAAAKASQASAGAISKAEEGLGLQILETFVTEPFDPDAIQPTRWHALNTLISQAAGQVVSTTATAKSVQKKPKQPADLTSLMKDTLALSK